MSNKSCLFILSESSWLTWISPFLQEIADDISLATYDFKPIKGVYCFSLDETAGNIVKWVKCQRFKKVILLTNQSSLARDYEIARILKKNNIKVISQSMLASKIGADKFKMKKLFSENNIPTPEYKIVSSINEAFKYAKKLEFPFLLKVNGLSEGRKMALVYSDDDIATYYYENAITQPIIMEKFIKGKEISTIVFYNFGKPFVFPLISKPTTDYLFSSANTRQRIYFAPDEDLAAVDKEIKDLALSVAEMIKNTMFVGFDIVIDEDKKPYILEFNARMTETMRMNMVLTKINIFKNLYLDMQEDTSHNFSLPMGSFVADVPLSPTQIAAVKKNKKIKTLAAISSTRVTLFSQKKSLVNQDIKLLENL